MHGRLPATSLPVCPNTKIPYRRSVSFTNHFRNFLASATSLFRNQIHSVPIFIIHIRKMHGYSEEDFCFTSAALYLEPYHPLMPATLLNHSFGIGLYMVGFFLYFLISHIGRYLAKIVEVWSPSWYKAVDFKHSALEFPLLGTFQKFPIVAQLLSNLCSVELKVQLNDMEGYFLKSFKQIYYHKFICIYELCGSITMYITLFV